MEDLDQRRLSFTVATFNIWGFGEPWRYTMERAETRGAALNSPATTLRPAGSIWLRRRYLLARCLADVHPDLIALQEVREGRVGSIPRGGWVRPLGATTQDIMDTGVVLRIRSALAAIEPDISGIKVALTQLASTHADTVMAGRTHGQHALPITFGFRDRTSGNLS